jgi:hypothetical protein
MIRFKIKQEFLQGGRFGNVMDYVQYLFPDMDIRLIDKVLSGLWTKICIPELSIRYPIFIVPEKLSWEIYLKRLGIT